MFLYLYLHKNKDKNKNIITKKYIIKHIIKYKNKIEYVSRINIINYTYIYSS